MRELRSKARQEYLSIGASHDLERPARRATGGASTSRDAARHPIAGPSTSSDAAGSASDAASRRDRPTTRASRSLARRDDVNAGFWAPASPNQQLQDNTYAAAVKSPPKKSPGKSPTKKRADSFTMDEDFPSLVEPSSPPYEPTPSQPMRGGKRE